MCPAARSDELEAIQGDRGGEQGVHDGAGALVRRPHRLLLRAACLDGLLDRAQRLLQLGVLALERLLLGLRELQRGARLRDRESRRRARRGDRGRAEGGQRADGGQRAVGARSCVSAAPLSVDGGVRGLASPPSPSLPMAGPAFRRMSETSSPPPLCTPVTEKNQSCFHHLLLETPTHNQMKTDWVRATSSQHHQFLYLRYVGH